MKVCILSAVNIKHMSLISLYTDILNKNNITYDIIYMDKYGEDEYFDCASKYRYVNVVNHSLPAFVKFFKYIKFRRFAKKILRKENYDFVIVWNDIAIFMFADYLAKHYKGKYCLNIRDYCGEKNPIVFRVFKKAIDNSIYSTISSEGFLSFLPKNNYLTIYSYNKSVLHNCQPRTSLREGHLPIRIGFVGNVRFFDINKKLIDVFKNDSRFELHYYGVNANVMYEYAKANNINNVFCGDAFPTEDTGIYLEKIDIINNLYGHGSIELDTALSIKLFHAAYMRMPILVYQNTYMQTISEKYDMGFGIQDIMPDLPDKLNDWYHSIDFIQLERGGESLIRIAEVSNYIFEQTFKFAICENSSETIMGKS